MKTTRLYRNDVYMKESTGKIDSIIENKGHTVLVLDQTIFFPTGGGQSCDKGVIKSISEDLVYPISDVYEDKDYIYHVIEKNPSEVNLAIRDKVLLSIDWERRFDNMQRHCGEHILSGMFFREFGGINRGFHMGNDYMTIDIDLSNTEYDKLTSDMIRHVELCTNQAIWENLPVITTHYDTNEEAKNEPLRKVLSIDEDITIVRVGSFENPSDAVACCGTHPERTGQIGMVKIYKVEPNKGMFRIYFDAGERAYKNYQKEFSVLTEAGFMLSAGVDDLIDKIKSKEEKISEVKDKLYNLEKQITEQEAKDCLKLLDTKPKTFVLKAYGADHSLDQLMAIGKLVGEKFDFGLCLSHIPSNTVLLFSSGDKNHCGNLVKELGVPMGGKGGGGAKNARIMFNDYDFVEEFIEKLYSI